MSGKNSTSEGSDAAASRSAMDEDRIAVSEINVMLDGKNSLLFISSNLNPICLHAWHQTPT